MQNKKQDKQPRNDKGQRHGFWELYSSNGNLQYKGLFLNGLEEGPFEVYYDNSQLGYKCNYIKGEYIGYYQWYNLDGSIYKTRFYAR